MGVHELVTAQTVQPILHRWFPQAQGALHVQPLAADASTRRYFRVQWSNSAPDFPPTYVLMACDPWRADETPDFLAVGRHLRACGVRVPQVYGILPAQGLMCLQDYGDRTLATHWQQGSEEDRLLWGRHAIDELVKMHTIATQHHDSSCPAFRLTFDLPKLLSELQFFCAHAIEGLWRYTLTATEREALDEAFISLCGVLASQPRYFCHRDYHGWNIMVSNDAVGVLDFQDARMGPQPYDLVSLLTDRGTPEVLGASGMAILTDYYIERLEAEESRRIDRSDFSELFEYVAIQRGLKAVGTFAYMTVVHQRRQYLPYIPPTLAYVEPLIWRYDALRPLAEHLHRYVPQWMA